MDQTAKQQVAEKLRSSANVLVTVSKNPSVDQLSAAIGLSLMLNTLGKHVATVFSGQIPDILSFLEPEKTFEDSVDGLRDFIISLDKEKADKLRYKVEDDVVRIFITPYRSKITDKDLKFEQGDFNVDAVVALGVRKKADLDEAITAHGRILHDATVIAVNEGNFVGNVGSINWNDEAASSLSEMLVSISEALEGGILDGPMSTAFLTGIVSVTDRFSNDKTTPKLMTMAAQLMAAGANQQLISEKLNISSKPAIDDKQPVEQKDDTVLDLSKSKKDKQNNSNDADQQGSKDEKPHKDQKDNKSSDQGSAKKKEDQPKSDDKSTLEEAAKEFKLDKLEKQLVDEADSPKASDTKPKDNKSEPDTSVPLPQAEVSADDSQEIRIEEGTGELRNVKSQTRMDKEHIEAPSMGGTFNATSETAHQEKKAEKDEQINNSLLSHGPKEPISAQAQAPAISSPPPVPAANVDDARLAVEQAMAATPFNPAGQPTEAINSQPMPDTEQQIQHNEPMQPSVQQMSPPPSPPPMPPPPPGAMPQTQPMPQPQQSPPPAPGLAQPAFNPVMDTANPAQTFNLPGQRAGMPPDQVLQQAQQPPQNPASQQQPMPPQDLGQPGAPPPPSPGNFPPPPQ